MVLLLVFLIVAGEGVGLHGADAAEVLVGIEGVGLQLYDGHGDVGAVVGHALVVGQEVVEHKALVQGTGTGLETVHMVGLHLIAQTVDDLLQRLHAGGLLDVVGHEGGNGDGQDLPQGRLHDLQLPQGGGGEHHVLVVYLLGRFRDVQGMVGDALEVGNGVEELADLLALGAGEGAAGDLHEIGAQLVLVAVDKGLRLADSMEALFGEIGAQRHGVQQVAGGALGHGVGDETALLDRQGGVLEEALLQAVHVLILGLGAVVGKEKDHQLFHQADEGQQRYHGGQTEQRVQKGDADGGHDPGQEGEAENGVEGVEHQGPDDHAKYVDEQVDEGGALAVEVGTQGRQQHRYRRADGHAHNDGEGDLKGDGAGDGQGLEDAHGGRGALQDAGEGDAHQNTQQGVGERGQDADEGLALPQRGDGAGHGGHAVHQNGEAQQDLAHVAVGGLGGEHAEDDAHHGHDAGEHLRAQQLHQAAAA